MRGSRIQSHCPCRTLWPISMLSRVLATARPKVRLPRRDGTSWPSVPRGCSAPDHVGRGSHVGCTRRPRPRDSPRPPRAARPARLRGRPPRRRRDAAGGGRTFSERRSPSLVPRLIRRVVCVREGGSQAHALLGTVVDGRTVGDVAHGDLDRRRTAGSGRGTSGSAGLSGNSSIDRHPAMRFTLQAKVGFPEVEPRARGCSEAARKPPADTTTHRLEQPLSSHSDCLAGAVVEAGGAAPDVRGRSDRPGPRRPRPPSAQPDLVLRRARAL